MSGRVRALVSVALCGGALFGCVMQRDHDALSARAANLEKELERSRGEMLAMKQGLDATRQRLDNALRANADSSTDVLSTKQRMKDLGGRLDAVEHGVEELRRDMNATQSELSARIDEIKRGQPAAAAPPPVAVPASKDAHIAALREARTKKDYAAVRALGPEYLNRYPTDANADEALWLVGDADLADGRPASALASFNRVLKLFPKSKLLDRTLFDMGEAYLLLHDCPNAKLTFTACESRFSKEKYGAQAREKLALIAKSPPGLCAPP